jgi:RimJ/RimL family protein N-acetyltransferase
LSAGEVAGSAGLRRYKPEAEIYELGFRLRPALQGHGFELEAGRVVNSYGFDSLRVKH